MLKAKSFFETPAKELTPQMEQDFFSSLMVSNKTYKTTYRDRFADVNPVLFQHLQRLQPRRAIRVLDIGISSGVSTLELYDGLSANGMNVTVVATDTLIDAFLVRVLPKCHALVDASGFPLRFDLPLVGMKPWVTPRDYRSGFFILRKAVNVAFTRRARKILLNPEDGRIKRTQLVSPRLQTNADIVVCNDDIHRFNSAFVGQFDLIRAANILNRGYFSPRTLTAMVTNIGRYLSQPSGTLLVVRTHEDHTSHGSLFRLADEHRFETVCHFGEGSEIEDIVLKSTIPAQ